MKIEWNKVTWYSKLLAVVVFLATFAVAFRLGVVYQTLRSLNTSPNQAPSAEETSWRTQTDVATGAIFKYPADLGTTYIHTVDWPPKLQIVSGPFVCTKAGSEIAQGGETQKISVAGHTYCRTLESEGAAGSIYNQYAYAFPANGGKVAILTFTLRFVQCANYPEPQMTQCTNERSAFDIDGIAGRMAATLTMR